MAWLGARLLWEPFLPLEGALPACAERVSLKHGVYGSRGCGARPARERWAGGKAIAVFRFMVPKDGEFIMKEAAGH